MLVQTCTIHQYIVKENDDTLTKERLKYVIHSRLECGRRIREPKRHNQKFKVAIVSPEGSFKDVCLMHMDLMITRMKI